MKSFRLSALETTSENSMTFKEFYAELLPSVYFLGCLIVGLISFAAIWIYACLEWGILIGLALGWIPAIIGALFLAFLWPLLLAVIVVIIIIFF